MTLVKFYNADVKYIVRRKTVLKKFIPAIFSKEQKAFQSIDIILCSDAYLLQLNKKFLNHDYYTDILTFDLSNEEEKSGEIYISIDRVKENSKRQRVSLQKELNRIVFHGILHLCGFGDKTKALKELMTAKEDKYLKDFDSFHVKQKQQ